ncbi:MAG TPA: pyridoxal-phosphate dependent enzyme [Vicinamibacteria bacterium]|nr:pyridoxal-phosphate dependent enzyme [Vicinamibacteria bacterium]
MTPEELRARLDAHPRVVLGETPTPCQELERLSAELRRPVFAKRDDLLGPALGGNKTRKLEYLMADARRQGATRVATFGGLQSNHARLTAAAASLVGMEAHLLYFEARPRALTGNLLVNQVLGARMHFFPLTSRRPRARSLEGTIRLARLLARLRVGPHYFIPVGGHTWVGALGYVRAAVEMDEQARRLGIVDAHVVVAAGSGGTLAGLLAGLRLVGSRLRPLGIDVGKLWKSFPAAVAHLASEVSARLGEPLPFEPADVPLVEGTYAGHAYGRPSEPGDAALERLARAEGILLDPVYTAKAFAGLLGEAEKGRFRPGEPIVFLHTGGAPALFA